MTGADADYRPVEQRFWSKVHKTDTCWLFEGAEARGYAKFRAGPRSESPKQAHRYAYELLVGPIPEGLELDHLCRVRNCVRPEHLEPVTHRENILRGQTVAAHNAARTHCANGHEFTEENTVISQNARRCRECGRRRGRESYARRRSSEGA